ncbi:aflatoxin B1-aldehyde reductase GliO-like, putative [Talaromyces stipitatus ATCC 10500]|uniref:Aflatoxin B1-aldehyde reductase GliO-like, putative n=1 Tax=Talaromyces stipitatus (strain ATCC 10500 / CBS 375.48 / QM 6759 / NRRL 1006) TaxID=441959 RepID=B8M249_TALSN|nr:aflatoxin B1-aldehyde reductase GliO-like, putative [Talaromyces stipitatus ATCC 10500]EED21513.1 aflatoxin B1-aldehyde reductase GliO-like, putative [Talaromyces stipitatus ATCC 10500]
MVLIASTGKPRVILGLMTYGPDPTTGARITSLDEYNKHLDYFQSQGYHEVDTARVYVGGKQEAFTREARWKERGLKIATKVYPTEPGLHKPETLRRLFETSLKELGTDQVDIFYLHAPDRSVPFAQTLEEVDKLHREGKFVELGLSNYTAFEVAEIVTTCTERGWVRPTIYQGMYNAITRSIETELIHALRRYGISLVIYNPLAGGLFSGKIKSKDIKPEEGRFSDVAISGPRYRERYFKDETFKALQIIENTASKNNLTPLEIAFRWLRHHSVLKWSDKGGDDGVILGVSGFEQLKNNLADLEKGPLPQEVVDALDEAWLVSKPTTAPYWHNELKYTYDTQAALFKK